MGQLDGAPAFQGAPHRLAPVEGLFEGEPVGIIHAVDVVVAGAGLRLVPKGEGDLPHAAVHQSVFAARAVALHGQLGAGGVGVYLSDLALARV